MIESERDIELDNDLFWPVRDEISFNEKEENFLDYLLKEKIIFDQRRSQRQKGLATIAILIFSFLLLSTIGSLVEAFFMLLRNEPIGPPSPQPEIYSILIFAAIFTSFSGIALVIVLFGFKYFFTKANWSVFHDHTLTLFRILDKVELLDNYISFENNSQKKRFRLKKISVDFQFQWIFPFIFDDFPPLFTELLTLSFLLPFFITTTLTIFFAFYTLDWVVIIVMSPVLLMILLGFYGSSTSILRSWKKYHWIRNLLINSQQAIIHNLILDNADATLILLNYHNLSRLESMHPFPLPSIIRLSALVPLLGSLIGYLIGVIILF
jgi:hypothetical protein